MKISYAITVCNELNEIKRLIPFLYLNKDAEDEIVVLFDEKNGSKDVLNYLLEYNHTPNIKIHVSNDFNNNFADWKNLLNSYCSGDYIFQLDADEIIDLFIIMNLKLIINNNPDVDLFLLPRVNTVEGLTDKEISEWGWYVNSKGWVNWPDRQGRLYKNGLRWSGKVHETIKGFKKYSGFPIEEDFAIKHHKDITRQIKQNNFYKTL